MLISDIFSQKDLVLSFEIFPPKKAAALENIDATLAQLCRLNPDFISVTCGAGGTDQNHAPIEDRTIDVGRRIKNDYGIEPLIHLTCLNYDKADIVTILEKLRAESLLNILALRGDAAEGIVPKNDFAHAKDLIAFVREQGGFTLGGACYPETHLEAADRVSDIRFLRQKVDEGASFLISQIFFENELFFDFVERCRIAGIDVPIEAGVMPVTNKAQIERIVSLCGATLPAKFRRILDRYADKPEALMDAGIAYAINQIVDLIASGVDGVHIYTMNKPQVAARICEGIENLIDRSPAQESFA
ncbi:MAG: methylenetetrahydrofolate reductase [NAD(P)H] [Lachnospiraceae bacterium]|nr:methylenetetrahydrofolate reductase [NAD(P)H] [Lachnospiraceae bacterium]